MKVETHARLTGDTCLDIPKGLECLARYRATLAHKACHSFSPNAAFAELHHPRFGDIMSIVAKRDIGRGEEVLVSYNYAIHQVRTSKMHIFPSHLIRLNKVRT